MSMRKSFPNKSEQNASVAVNLHLSAMDGASFVLNSRAF